MNTISTSAILLMAEGLVVLLGIIVVYLFVTTRRLRRERDLVRAVVKGYRQKEPARREVLQEVLRDGCGHGDEEIATITDDFSRREKALYNNITRMFLGRDRQAIKGLDERVQSIVRGYQKLVMNEPVDDSAQERGAGQLPYTQLRKENERLNAELDALRKELHDARLTADNIMKEYATMYAGGEREGEMKVREELKKLRERDWTQAGEDNAPGTAALDPAVLDGEGDTGVEDFSTDEEKPATP